MIPFDKYDWIKIKDLEKCPYPPFRNSSELCSWIEKDNKRVLLIALERYANHLQQRRAEW